MYFNIFFYFFIINVYRGLIANGLSTCTIKKFRNLKKGFLTIFWKFKEFIKDL